MFVMGQKTKVLAVDDEQAFTHLLKLNLESRGLYEVRTENSAKNALQTAVEFEPDVVLLDVVMPELDGVDLIVAFRNHPKLEKTPVILITALLESASQSRQPTLAIPGGVEMFSKPVDLDALREAIDRCAGRVPDGDEERTR